MIRLVACDVDGTLIGHDRLLPDERRAAIRRLVDADIRVVLATGKIWPSIRPLWETLSLPGPHVTCNGAALVEGDGRLLACTPLDRGTAAEVAAELARRAILHAIYFEDGTLVTARRVPELDVLVELGEPDPEVGQVRDRRVLKVLSVIGPDEEADHRELAAARARIQWTSHRFLEWNHPDADKALGLRRVVEHLGLTMDEVVAIGDAENDVPMPRAAGTSVAVRDASAAGRVGADDFHLVSNLSAFLDEVAASAAGIGS